MRTRVQWLALATIGVLITLSPSYALEPEIVPGYENVALGGAGPGYSSPAIAEIDGNSANGKEVTVGVADGRVVALKSNGSLLWSVTLPSAGCAGGTKVFSSPAVGALYGDGVPYVVIGYGNLESRACDGGVVAIRGSDGKVAWTFSIKSFAKKNRFFAFRNTVFSTPALADTDHDGKLEIGFGGFDRSVYLLNANGSVRWYYQAADTVWSSPAFADVDGDNRLEMIIGTDISQNLKLKPATPNGGFVYAMKTNSRKGKLIRFQDPSAFVWRATFDQVIYSSPVVAELIPENPGLEVVIGSGCFFPQNSNDKNGKWFKVLSLKTGAELRTLEVPACSASSAAIADLDSDGLNEVVVTASGATNIGGDGDSKVIAFNPRSNTKLWEIVPAPGGNSDNMGGHFNSPIIADLDGNGTSEVIANNSRGVVVIAGVSGEVLSCQNRSCSNEVEMITNDVLRNTPAVDDINGDGEMDLVVASKGSGGAKLFAWTSFNGLIGSPQKSGNQTLGWPMARGDATRRAARN